MSESFIDRHTREYVAALVPRIRRIGHSITARQVSRRLWRFRYAGEGLLQYMVQFGYGRWEERRPGPRGGRPTRVYVFNDDLDETAQAAPPKPPVTDAIRARQGF